MTPVRNNPSLKCASGNRRRHSNLIHEYLRHCWLGFLCCVMLPLQAAELDEHRVENLDYGRALFHFFQENELNAITRLMIAQERPITQTQLDEANLLLADLYYSYGLYEESREMFARLLTAEVSESIQDRIWFNLARLRFEQGFPEHARDLLSRISTKLPKNIEAERKYLLTNLFLIDGQYGPAIRMSRSTRNRSSCSCAARSIPSRSGKFTPATMSRFR